MWIAKSDLIDNPSIPKGVRDYFRDYALKREMFGVEVLTISQRLDWNWEDDQRYKGKALGYGPAHNVNQQCYEKNMPKKEDKRKGVKPGTFYPISINEWVSSKEGQKLVVSLVEIGERHTCSADCD